MSGLMLLDVLSSLSISSRQISASYTPTSPFSSTQPRHSQVQDADFLSKACDSTQGRPSFAAAHHMGESKEPCL